MTSKVGVHRFDASGTIVETVLPTCSEPFGGCRYFPDFGAACAWGYPCTFTANFSDGTRVEFRTINGTLTRVTASGGVFAAPPAQPLSLSMAHSTSAIAPGERTELTYTLTNPNTDRRLVASSANFAHDISYYAPGGVHLETLPAAGFCGASSTATSGTGAAPGSFLTFTGIELGPGESCSFSITYRIGALLPGTLGQLTGLVYATFPDQPTVVGPSTSVGLTVTNAPDTVPPTVTVVDQVITLDDGVLVGGGLTASASDDRGVVGPVRYYLGGVEIPSDHGFGQIAGTYTVEAVARDGALNETREAFDVTVHSIRHPSFLASVTPGVVGQGGTATLEFDISLPVGGSPLEGIQFDFNLAHRHPGLFVEAADLPARPCGAGSNIVLTGTSFISLRSGALSGGQSCRFSIPFHVSDTASIISNSMQTSPLSASHGPTGITKTAPGHPDPF